MIVVALLLPIVLGVLLGGTKVGMWAIMRTDLGQAAYEAAVVGALNPGTSCGLALVAAREVYDRPKDHVALDTAECEEVSKAGTQYVQVTLTDTLNFPIPFWADPVLVKVTKLAALR